jgi:hypothetical protein
MQRAGNVRAMTGFTAQECTALLPHFEHACVASMEDHTLDGQPRTSRRDRTDDTWPVPTRADRLLCMLTSDLFADMDQGLFVRVESSRTPSP